MAMAWYVVHTFSGFENKVKLALEERIKLHGLVEKFGPVPVLVPTEQVVEVKDGKKRTVQRKFFPGYILVNMEMDNATQHVVKDTPKVTGFVGGGRTPPPVPEDQVKRLVQSLGGEDPRPKVAVNFKRGDEVRVIEGPLAPVTAKVEEVNAARGRLKVTVTFIGRPTVVELDFTQVERVG